MSRQTKPARTLPKSQPSGHRPAAKPNRFLTPINIALVVGLIGIAAAAVWQERKSEDHAKPTTATAASTPADPTTTPPMSFDPSQLSDEMKAPIPALLPIFAAKPPTLGLDPPGPSTRVPVNSVDLFTSKPISYASPKVEYKGYQVAFCCKESVGYRAAWMKFSEAEKDSYVRHFVETGGAP